MKKVLVLDDNIDILQIVTEVLSYEHFEVKSIDKSAEVILLAQSFKPDLILLDFRLADGNGDEICRACKQHLLLRHIPIIIFSAYVNKEVDLLDYGCDAVIIKPFDIIEPVQQINDLIGYTTNSTSAQAFSQY